MLYSYPVTNLLTRNETINKKVCLNFKDKLKIVDVLLHYTKGVRIILSMVAFSVNKFVYIYPKKVKQPKQI